MSLPSHTRMFTKGLDHQHCMGQSKDDGFHPLESYANSQSTARKGNLGEKRQVWRSIKQHNGHVSK